MTKLAESDARKTAAPPSSSSFPKLFIGVQQKFTAAIGAVEQSGIQVGAEDSGSDGIDANSKLGPFDGQRLGQRAPPRLCWHCRPQPHRAPTNDDNERNINDSAIAALDHVPSKDATGA